MKLCELAYACPRYAAFTDFDKSISRFRDETRPALDLGQPAHRKALLVWLNSWGIMQLSRRHHPMASKVLQEWRRRYLDRLPHEGVGLAELPDVALVAAAEAYGALNRRRASLRLTKSGPIAVTFGPTAAAKVLHALRPRAFPPWDRPIRKYFGYDGSRDSYRQFLSSVQKNIHRLEEEAAQLGIRATEIPALVRRESSSLTKLIDEYYWVTITKKCRPPTQEEIERWLRWAHTRKG